MLRTQAPEARLLGGALREDDMKKLTQTQALMILMAGIQIRAFKDAMRRKDDAAAMQALQSAHTELGRLLTSLAANDNAAINHPSIPKEAK